MKFVSRRLILVTGLAWVAAAFPQNQTPAQLKPPMAGEVFKNVQVLKAIPVDEFMGTMGLFSAALTVCCGDCHTGAGTANPKWEDDPPRKLIARRMIQMVNALNRESFGGRQVVTCWTCHRGTPSPAITPSIDTIYATEPVIVPPDVLPTAQPSSAPPTVDQIFDKYIQVLGGAGAVTKLTSYSAKGTGQLFGEPRADAMEVYAKVPNQLVTIVHQQEGDLVRSFDGRNGWVLLPLTVVPEYPLTAGALEGARLDAQLAFPGGLKQFFNNWRVSYPGTVDGRDLNVVQATGAAGMVATFYFDKQSGLLTRVIHYAPSAVGRVPVQFDYSDYRAVAGVMLPFKWTYGWLSGREEYTLTDVQPNIPIDPAKFAKPVARAR